MGHELARLFDYAHLPEHLQVVSKPFAELADKLFTADLRATALHQGNTDLTLQAVMKLWEAKNLAVVVAAQFGHG